MRVLLIAVVAAFTFAGVASAATSARDRAAIAAVESRLRLSLPVTQSPAETTLAARMAELKVPGVSIAFIEDGRVKWVRTYGVTEAGQGRPVSPDTLFQAASMSKVVAAAGALRLVELGRLDLDEDVNQRLKTWRVPSSTFTSVEKVTLRRLLSHTAGLTVGGFPGYRADKPVPTVIQILDGLPPAGTPAVRSFEVPGGAYAYSGGGYTVAQLLMIDAGDEPYPALMEKTILRPAGMRRSNFDQPLSGHHKAASGHDAKGATIAGGRNTYPEYAAAGLWTTPSDYGRFLIGLQNAYLGRSGGLLRQSTAQLMMTPVHSGYGLGVVTGRRGGRPTFEHGGSNFGFRCDSFAFLDGTRQGAVIMTNGDGGGRLVAEIFRELGDAYQWGKADAPAASSSRRAPFLPLAAK